MRYFTHWEQFLDFEHENVENHSGKAVMNRFGEFSVIQLMWGITPCAEGRHLSVGLETSMTTQTTDQDCLFTCGQAGEGN